MRPAPKNLVKSTEKPPGAGAVPWAEAIAAIEGAKADVAAAEAYDDAVKKITEFQQSLPK